MSFNLKIAKRTEECSANVVEMANQRKNTLSQRIIPDLLIEKWQFEIGNGNLTLTVQSSPPETKIGC